MCLAFNDLSQKKKKIPTQQLSSFTPQQQVVIMQEVRNYYLNGLSWF